VGFHRKNKRLTPPSYVGRGIYFVTVCCEKRCPVFVTESAGTWLVKWLTRCAAQHEIAVHAYCVMPDHLHVLAEGTNENCDLVRFVSEFKQQTGYLYQRKAKKRLWQARYYDHVLRKPEDTEAVAWYIWTNPVRKGICAAPQEYPLSGSLTMDWRRRCAPTKIWTPVWRRNTTEDAALKGRRYRGEIGPRDEISDRIASGKG
jgi:putative transposase